MKPSLQSSIEAQLLSFGFVLTHGADKTPTEEDVKAWVKENPDARHLARLVTAFIYRSITEGINPLGETIE